MPKIVDREEIRGVILDAAMGVFADKGYHASTISDVATAAGMAKGTFYIYFESKDELTIAIVDRHFAAIAEQISGMALSDTLDGFLERLRSTMDVSSEEASFHRSFFEIFGSSFASDEFTEHIAGFFDSLGTYYGKQIAHLQKLGEIASHHNASSVGRLLASMLDGIVLHKGLFGVSQQRHRRMANSAVVLLGAGLRSSPPSR